MNILVADAGNSSTHWIFRGNDQNLVQIKTEGIHPIIDSPERITEVIEQFRTKSQSIGFEKVFFYGTGCFNPKATTIITKIMEGIFDNAAIYVSDDLSGSARALFSDHQGCASILGTGSNAGLYDGHKITKRTTSLGYLLGDEGSGTYIGKEFVKYLFKGNPDKLILQDFETEFGIEKENLIPLIYSKTPPNRYLASFAPFVCKHRNEKSINDLLKKVFSDYLREILEPVISNNYTQIGIVGSIGINFKDIIDSVLQEKMIKKAIYLADPAKNLFYYHEKKEADTI